jgi:hypothetical protein
MKESGNRVNVGSLSTALFAAAALSGCTVSMEREASVSTIDQSLADQMTADSQYMSRLLDTQQLQDRQLTAARRGVKVSDVPDTGHGSLHIDLADPAQRRFVMNRLAAAGKTAANSPQLFERIQRSTVKAIARAATGATASATASNLCRNFVLLGKEVKTTKTTIQFQSTQPNVTCAGGAEYVFVDVTSYNSNLANTENFLVQSAAGEDFTGGQNFHHVTITPTLPAVMGRVNKTDSVLLAFTPDGTEISTFTQVRTAMLPVPSSIGLVHPKIHPWIQNGGNIQMCQLRGLPNQCDYGVGQLAGSTFTGWSFTATTGIAPVTTGTGGTTGVPWAGDVSQYFAFTAPYNPSRIYVPTQGTFDVGATATGVCTINAINFAELRLIKEFAGGSCRTTASFASSATWPAGSGVGSFRTISEFVNDGGTLEPTSPVPVDCTQAAIINEPVRAVVIMSVASNCGGTPVNRFITLAPGGMLPALTEYMFFLNSCFAEGTGIRRADGTTVAVEKVKKGDKVIADNKGTILTVTGVSNGNENEPLVELKDNKGHEIRLTSRHPLVKASGEVVWASRLSKGDRVMTDRGVATIVSANRVEYKGQVYNLSVGTDAEKAKVGKDGTTMFAGGFLAGDSAMQQAHEQKVREVAQVPSSWQRDYRNALVNNPPMQRVLR